MHSILFITVKTRDHYVYLHHGLFSQVILNTKYERRYAPLLHIFKTNNTKSDGVIDMLVYGLFFFYFFFLILTILTCYINVFKFIRMDCTVNKRREALLTD